MIMCKWCCLPFSDCLSVSLTLVAAGEDMLGSLVKQVKEEKGGRGNGDEDSDMFEFVWICTIYGWEMVKIRWSMKNADQKCRD